MISIAELTALAQELTERDRKISSLEEELKCAKESARAMREETLPAALTELGVTSITLLTGEKLNMKQEVYASIPVEKRAEAYDWLERQGFESIIKTTVAVQFGKGELHAAEELMESLFGQGLQPSFNRDVHAQTLKAFLREQLAAGRQLPLELFGARPVWTAKISTK